ncbi:hypothetical protein SETIT_5G406600v2 [Setaria italica]|uniref:Uncharacterized protein n=2 Tax=Setaria TaxID=4554 RepID=A0A368RE87_SETIT|nr:hypothetical protein SETIT_5G406600v2 [Setaria italica]TKW18127.1 hypothetical protein SEVIR_5G412100v2 [Setaria viridis]
MEPWSHADIYAITKVYLLNLHLLPDGPANLDRAYCIRWPTRAHKLGRAAGGGVLLHLQAQRSISSHIMQVPVHSNGLFAGQQRKLVQESGKVVWMQLTSITFMWSISWLKDVKCSATVRR